MGYGRLAAHSDRMNNSRSLFATTGLTLVAVLALAACGPGSTSSPTPGGSTPVTSATPGASTSASTGTVNVTVQEFAILPDADSAPAGDVTFVVTNDGPDDVHEFVVIKTDVAPDALPTNADGSVNEDDPSLTVIDEIEDIAVGDTEELTVSLDAGAYVLICNIFDEEEEEAHYGMGMWTAFTVE